jgi:hypothetical protein
MAENSMLSETTIQELKQILKEEYGRDLDLREASEIAHNLVGYFNLLAKIRHREEGLKNNYDDNKSKDN